MLIIRIVLNLFMIKHIMMGGRRGDLEGVIGWVYFENLNKYFIPSQSL
jgi:hypothetical protein